MSIDWTAVLTGVLVVVTGVYVWLTHRAVEEAREARKQALRPVLAVDPVPAGPVHLYLRLFNAGPGPAIDVELNFVWRPRVPEDQNGPREQRFTFVWPAVAPGQQHQFDPVDYPAGQGENQMQWLAESFSPLEVRGTCKDVLGRTHSVAQTMDLKAWLESGVGRSELMSPTPTSEVGRELHALQKELKKVSKLIQKLTK